ncbi:MAG: hypothetical protein IKA31_02055 [Clostridia bacterium]|nr:hypothetical protein [Clostridia bacterium]
MNGILGNTRYVNLSKVDDVQLDGESIVTNRIAELNPIVSKIRADVETIITQNSYTREEVNNLIANRAGFEIVNTLPTENISLNKIYLLKLKNDNDATDNDVYDEYIYINNAWEHVGSFQADFSNYYTKDEVVGLLNDTLEAVISGFETTQQEFENLKTHVGAIDDVLDAINGEVV